MPEDHYLTVAQVAELLHVSTKTVFTMTKDGRLPARRLPGTRRYLYVRSEIIDLVDQYRTDDRHRTDGETDLDIDADRTSHR